MGFWRTISQLVPISSWLPGCSWQAARGDIVAGVAIAGLLIFRPNGIVFFANANRVHNRLRELVQAAEKPLRAVIVNLEASPEIDVTCFEMLGQLRSELRNLGIPLTSQGLPIRFVICLNEADF